VIRTRLEEILEKEKDGMSVYRLAQLTGLSEITITNFLKKKGKGVFYNTLDRICDALGCKPGDLLVHESDNSAIEEGGHKE
jgi:putative transcriptional regulator